MQVSIGTMIFILLFLCEKYFYLFCSVCEKLSLKMSNGVLFMWLPLHWQIFSSAKEFKTNFKK